MRKHYLLIFFLLILISFTIIDIFNKDKDFSDVENSKLNKKTKFTLSSFVDGSFQKAYEKYINDQFVFRDRWINLKSISEYGLGKIENNGIIYGDDKYLFEKFNTFDIERLEKNVAAINSFLENNKDKTSIMIIPNSYEVYKELLPTGLTLVNQGEVIENVYEQLQCNNKIKIKELLDNNKEAYIYYKTDHHWTTYGAYLAYCEFMKSINEELVDINELEGVSLDGFYGTYFSKAKPFNIQPDKLTYYELDNVSIEIGEEYYPSIYDYSKIELRDKYALFLYGNNGLSIIKNNNLNNGKKMLVIKDSFANSLIPFLTQNYEEIHVIDLRNYTYRLSGYLKENEFDNILLCYNIITLCKDNVIVRIKF